MPITISGVDNDIAILEAEIEGVIKQMAEETGDLINGDFEVVDTGFFMSNWNVTFGGPDFTVKGTRPSSSGVRVFGPPDFSFTELWRITDESIYFANDVEYADLLDEGRSTQAPQGITDPVAGIIDARFRDVRI